MRNPREWSELCKRNDWTDVSDAKEPPSEWVPRETFDGGGTLDAPPPAPTGNSGEGETHRFAFRSDD